MSKKLTILSRVGVRTYRPEGTAILISVTNPDSDWEMNLPDPFPYQKRLCLRFWDADDACEVPHGFWTTDNPPPKAISEEDLFSVRQARLILDFVKEHDSVDEIVCQCEGGISRSSGIAAALAHCMDDLSMEAFIFSGGSGTQSWSSRWIPCRRVYRTIVETFHEND